MMPHHGQVTISLFENAVALAYVINNDALLSVQAQLHTFERERKAPAEHIQKSSRSANDCLHLPEGRAHGT
ncbi:hypothetical protein [Sodalis sp.]|uniref:hypothetical protein n=1 Tax=Sodalis sp. (in: enterobacteria) TaxID=1898979 RepID=UPI003872BE55